MLWLPAGIPAGAGERLADQACRAHQRLRSVWSVALPARVEIEVAGDGPSFQQRSGKGPAVAAALIGERILTRPLASLDRLVDVEALLVHEMAHLAIRRSAGWGCPRWLDEGLAQRLAGETASAERVLKDEDALRALEARLARAPTPADYRMALALVVRLEGQVGLPALLAALPSLRTEPELLRADLAGRSLCQRLFESQAASGGGMTRD